MKYHFKVTIHTDGDFHFPFVPCGMKDDGYEFYMLDKSYKNRSEAIQDILNICAFLNEQMHTESACVRDYWNNTINYFVSRLQASEEKIGEYVCASMDGNYYGTEFVFKSIANTRLFELMLTDEEYELISKNKNGVTIGMVHDAILALFKEVT